MCRFAVRQPGAAPPPAAEAVKLEVPLDLESLFDQGADDLDANGERERSCGAPWVHRPHCAR